MTSAKVNGSLKLGLGTNTSGEIGTELSTSATTKETRSVTISKTEHDDEIGTVKVYFYDPIILEKVGDKYVVNSYSVGGVTFGLMVK